MSFVVACGGGNGLLSGNQAADLSNQLNTLSSAVASFHCGAAKVAARSFSDSVANLPSTINTTLAQNLAQGASTVSQLAAVDCQGSSSTSSTSTTPTTKTSTTSSSTSSTTSTSTTTTPTSSTTTSTSTSSSATTPTSSSTTSTTTPTGGTGVGTNGNGTGNGGNGQ